MNVAIINTFDMSGGAAKAAYRLNTGLNQIGVNSTMVVKNKISDDKRVCQIKINNSKSEKIVNSIKKIQRNYINKNRSNISNSIFSISYPGYDLSSLNAIQQADVINLHWINNFLSIETIDKILSLGKPVVWTLHDQWPFTGGCHYSAGCMKYKSDCKGCPQLNNDPYNVPYYVLKNKLKHFKGRNLTIVTPSRWLAKEARESILFKSIRIEVIPNAIPHDIFKPLCKEKAKSDLGISNDTIAIFFAPPNGKAKRKGFQQLIEALQYCMSNEKFKKLNENKKVMALIAGHTIGDLMKIPISFKSFGFISSEQDLNLLYNAADILALPSLEDNLPNQMLEALSCATPVIAFDIGGISDLVIDNVTGRLTPSIDTYAYGNAILDLTLNEEKRTMLGMRGREIIESSFKLKDQAERYLNLFKSISNTRPIWGRRRFSNNDPLIANIDFTIDKNLQPLFENYLSNDG